MKRLLVMITLLTTIFGSAFCAELISLTDYSYCHISNEDCGGTYEEALADIPEEYRHTYIKKNYDEFSSSYDKKLDTLVSAFVMTNKPEVFTMITFYEDGMVQHGYIVFPNYEDNSAKVIGIFPMYFYEDGTAEEVAAYRKYYDLRLSMER